MWHARTMRRAERPAGEAVSDAIHRRPHRTGRDCVGPSGRRRAGRCPEHGDTMLRIAFIIAFTIAVATSPVVVVVDVPPSQTIQILDRLAPAILPLPRRRRR